MIHRNSAQDGAKRRRLGRTDLQKSTRRGRGGSHVLDRARERSKRKSPPGLFRRAL